MLTLVGCIMMYISNGCFGTVNAIHKVPEGVQRILDPTEIGPGHEVYVTIKAHVHGFNTQ